MDFGEFDLIARYFAPLASEGPPAFGLADDAAVLRPAEGRELVFTKDALVASVHFFADDPPDLVARKALRVNLSDLAGMGAAPLGYLLALALPRDMSGSAREAWVAAFADGLARDQQEFSLTLLGGDTVATPGPLTLSVTAVGMVEADTALHRSGAQAGDGVYVSGTLGDAALGLLIREGALAEKNTECRGFLEDRYLLPRPRLELGQALRGIAGAAMDISDGLVADLRHICEASGIGARITTENVPLSPAASKVLERFPDYKNIAWQGGDDYELLFTASDREAEKIAALSRRLDIPLTRIGRMTEGADLRLLDGTGRNLLIPGEREGFSHF